MDWVARTQYVAQSGIPKIDLAFWLKQDQYFSVAAQYHPTDLERTGFSYEYLSPDNFDLADAVINNGTLAPARQAFKALIIRGNDTLTVPGVTKLVQWANEGLPVVISGGLPQNLTGYDTGNNTAYVRSALAGILGLDNVHSVPYDNLAASLMALGFTPRTSVSADRIWYTYWREDAKSSITWVYVYNDAFDSEFGEGSSTGSVTLETTGVPYMYDAWTGEVQQIYGYQQSEIRTTIPLTLAGNQSVIIGFHTNETVSNSTTILSLPVEVYATSSQATPHGNLITLKAGNTTEIVQLSNGTSISLPIPAAPIDLSNWTLTIESWAPHADLNQTETIKTNTTYQLNKLIPWNHISDSLRNTSGRGYYSASFSWPPVNGSVDGAMLSLGALNNAARARVNGKQLPPLDPTNGLADIGPHLISGKNQVEIVIGTTLGNVLRPIYRDVVSSGTVWGGPEPTEQEYGLVGEVAVVPYRNMTVLL
jgi:hypothetical protein